MIIPINIFFIAPIYTPNMETTKDFFPDLNRHGICTEATINLCTIKDNKTYNIAVIRR